MKIGVKYCGGCNSSYDRTAAVDTIRARMSGHELVPYTEDGAFDAVLVVCGCSSRCAKTADHDNKVFIAHENEIDEAAETLLQQTKRG